MGGKLQGAERWCPTILSTLVVTYLVILIKEFCGERSLWTAGDCSGISSALFGRNLRSDENEDLSHVLVLLFMFFGLSLGILVMQTLSHVGEAIPYTVLVFLMGIVFAAISDKSEGRPVCLSLLLSSLTVSSICQVPFSSPFNDG